MASARLGPLKPCLGLGMLLQACCGVAATSVGGKHPRGSRTFAERLLLGALVSTHLSDVVAVPLDAI